MTPSLVCDMTALSATERMHHRHLLDTLAQATRRIEELPDGYRFWYETGEATWHTAVDFVELERRCCPLFRARHG